MSTMPSKPWYRRLRRIMVALADPGPPLWWPEHFDTDECPPESAALCRICIRLPESDTHRHHGGRGAAGGRRGFSAAARTATTRIAAP